MSLCLDIDVVRGLFGGWLDQPLEAGLMARRLPLTMAQVVLSEGRDVVVPQFLGRPGFIGELEDLARQVAHVLLDRDGGPSAVAEMHRRLQDVLARRSGARRVVPVPGDVEGRTVMTDVAGSDTWMRQT